MVTGQNKEFWDDPRSMEPLLPSARRAELEALAWDLGRESAALGAALHPLSRTAISHLLRVVNSYYSNLIEGHNTHPRDIEKAYRLDYAKDPAKRELQIEAKAHVEVERRMRHRLGGLKPAEVTSPDFLCWLHQCFYEHLPTSMWEVHGKNGAKQIVVPGTFRSSEVVVGNHGPPTYVALKAFLNRFHDAYRPDLLSGTDRVIAAAASHHRLLWIHPFLDGNGRVARLFTEAYLAKAGVDGGGLWSVSRGLARRHADYKSKLAVADDLRRGDVDGRGNLSDQALADYCIFFLSTALDQVRFTQEMLSLETLQARMRAYIELSVQRGEVPKQTIDLVREALLRGKLERGEALSLLGGAERTARKQLGSLLDIGLVSADGMTHRSAIRWAVPVVAAGQYFSDLFPANPADQLESASELTFVQKLRSLSDEALNHALDSIIADHVGDLSDHEDVAGAMAMTNAVAFGVDGYEFDIEDVDLFDDDEARVKIAFHLTGDHDDEKMYSGHEIEGSAVLVISSPEDVSFKKVSAERVEYPPEEGERS